MEKLHEETDQESEIVLRRSRERDNSTKPSQPMAGEFDCLIGFVQGIEMNCEGGGSWLVG